MNAQVPLLRRSLADIVEEYDFKVAHIADTIAAFTAAGHALATASTIEGCYGGKLDTGHASEHEIARSLLKSAWAHVYAGLHIARIASADDKRKFSQMLEQPPAFTLENIRDRFGDFILKPRANILRGLAEVFCSLDPIYKSHDKMKIGVKGLPKRVILSNVKDFGSWGKDRLESILNALAAVQGKPLVTWREISALLSDPDALAVAGPLPTNRTWDKPEHAVARGVRLKRFDNGNGHLSFDPATLNDINRALAEYYGDVLPDTPDENPTKRPGTAVSKDLQYYPTPKAVVDRVIAGLYRLEGQRVLEPSCGCGRFMDALRKAGATPFGIEYDAARVAESRAKGHTVLHANFLETAAVAEYDLVVMNPPFYGKHYALHVEHALKFLKPGGRLVAILPITARYDHGLVNGSWDDLPVGSFSESGTNINTTVLTIMKREGAA